MARKKEKGNNIRLPMHIRDRADVLAKYIGVSRNDVVKVALTEFINRYRDVIFLDESYDIEGIE